MRRLLNSADNGLPTWLYLWLILISIVLRLFIVGATNSISRNDDSLAYLTATGHLGEYRDILADTLFPIGEWTQVEQWKQFIKIDESFPFRVIMYDSSYYDVHPPLYFWILHLWLKLWGLTRWAGPVLNIILDLMTALIMLRFASQYLGENGAIALVTLWLLHPFTIMSSIWTRQYSLFTLSGVGFTIVLFNILVLRRVSIQRLISLILITVCGLLTHYYFSFWVAIGALFEAINICRSRANARHVIGFLIILVLVATLYIALFPDFFTPLINYTLYNPDNIRLTLRIRKLVLNSILLWSPLALSIFLILLRNVGQSLSAALAQYKLLLTQQYSISLLLLWMSGFAAALWLIVGLLYMLGISPAHAMGEKYLTFITPYVAFLALVILIVTKLNHKKMYLWLIAGMLLLDCTVALYELNISWMNESALAKLRGADAVVLDGVGMGSWPGVILHLQNDREIFAANKEYLQEHSQQWVPGFCHRYSVYVAVFSDMAERSRKEITDLISMQCKIRLDSEIFGRQGIVYYEIYYKVPPVVR